MADKKFAGLGASGGGEPLSPRAWSGAEALVLASSPEERRELGARLATAGVSVFSSYGEAYDYAKKKGSVAFAAVSDLAGEGPSPLPLEDAVSQLLRAYETKGWPGFGVLLRSGGSPTAAAARAAARSPRILDYLPAAEATPEVFWSLAAAAFEGHVAPEALRNTLEALAAPALPGDSRLFLERLTLLLGGPDTGAGLNWFELTGALWLPVIEALGITAPAAAEANPVLAQLASLAKTPQTPSSADEALELKAAPAARVAALAKVLDGARREGRLKEEFDALEKRDAGRAAAPVERQGAGDPLRRRPFYSRDRILSIAAEAAAGEPGEPRR